MKNLMNAFLGGKEGAIGLVILAVLILLVMPMFLDIFRLNLMGKYLTFAFVAIGLVLCWGLHGHVPET
jgi:urea transport system permease protein